MTRHELVAPAPGAGEADELDAVVRVENLVVRYGAILAVERLDLIVPERSAVALLGANGAGKTSTLMAISGLVAHQGRITVGDEDVGGWRPDRIARHGVAHVPEGRRLFPNLTVQENLSVSRSGRGGRARQYDPDRVYDLFEPLRPLRRRPAWALSGGEQQMVAVGRALCAAPRILLLDEPTLGLAPVVVDQLYEALKGLRGEVAMLVVEQASELALALCEQATVLTNGRASLSGSASELAERDDLLASYLGRA